MNREQIYDAIESLAHSQGFYGRMLDYLKENPKALDALVEQNFTDVVDLVMYLEQ